MAVIRDGRDIDAVAANMLIGQLKWGNPSWGSLFLSKHIGTFLVEGVDGNAVALGDDLVPRLRRERFHSVPSMMSHCRDYVVAGFSLNWWSYKTQSKS